MELIDQIEVTHFFEKPPTRIVSLVPSHTDTLFEMGLEDCIVGITKFCVHPKHFKKTKKIVGGTKSIHIDKILALNPDIIICNKEENTLEMVLELKKICKVWVTNIINLADNKQMILDFGAIFNKGAAAKKMVVQIDFAIENFKITTKNRPLLKVAYFIWKNPWMVAGGNTYVNSLLKLNGLDNVCANKPERYPEIQLKNIDLNHDLDLVFLSSEPFPFKQEDAFEIEQFTHHAKTIFVDGEMFSWHGTRLLQALDYFKILQKTTTNVS
jgi:iron complex transport system substrate-binding protein